MILLSCCCHRSIIDPSMVQYTFSVFKTTNSFYESEKFKKAFFYCTWGCLIFKKNLNKFTCMCINIVVYKMNNFETTPSKNEVLYISIGDLYWNACSAVPSLFWIVNVAELWNNITKCQIDTW